MVAHVTQLLNSICEQIASALETLRADDRRLDMLTSALTDESWHARIDSATPETQLMNAWKAEAAGLERSINNGLEQLRAQLGVPTERK